MLSESNVTGRRVGRYILYDEIASGGMASVHLGRLLGPVGFSRTVAIKRLLPHFAKDAEFVSMFMDEARLAARVQHPNVVPTVDVVSLEDELFLVMEYVKGESLAVLWRAAREGSGEIPVAVAVTAVIGALHGLHAAHEATGVRGEALDIVHRDVSPQNILIGLDGTPRVLDFGVAKAAGRLQATREGQVKGKVSYMSPEQVRGESVDRRTDVYAASVVLWELLTGKRLFEADTQMGTMNRVLEQPVEPPSRARPAVPESVSQAVMRGLARRTRDRYLTARAMAMDLEGALAPLTAREMGDWVESMAGPALSARAARLALIESSLTGIRGSAEGDDHTSAPPRPMSSDASTRTSSHVVVRPPEVLASGSQVSSISVSTPALMITKGRASWRRRLLAVGALLLVALAVVVRWNLSPGTPKTVAAVATSARGVPDAAVIATLEEPPPSAVQEPPPVTPPSAGSVAPPRKVVRTSPRVQKPTAPPVSQGASPPPVPSNCVPPYRIEPDGHRTPKPWCL